MSDPAFYSREYNNRALVPEHPQFFARWADSSARARATMICYLDRRYGEAPGETMDIVPARKGDGSCMMFIHGGYWRSLDKSDFSFLAPAAVDAGVSLAVVNYDLCPRVTVEEIVQQMLRASRWLYLNAEQYGMDEDRLYVLGLAADDPGRLAAAGPATGRGDRAPAVARVSASGNARAGDDVRRREGKLRIQAPERAPRRALEKRLRG
ncbi:MAG: alpha/beta hydrolase fold domain-containing protein [Betaproteobacteria bacterium]|nr:alpha/beta hydrolase fold domain-containing protein [Betaproteobacteria bacterium]